MSAALQFQSIAEVDAWLDHEQVECLECHRRFEHLGRHVSAVHGMSADEFRARYGIPHNRGLVGALLKDRIVERQRRIMATDPEHRRKFVDAITRKPYSVHPPSTAQLGDLIAKRIPAANAALFAGVIRERGEQSR